MAIKIGTAAFDLIMRYARKRLASPNAEGIMEVMSNKQAMDFVKDLIEEFNRFGVPESAITKVDDVGVIANEIMNIKQKQITEAFKKQMTPKKSAQVFDLQGNKIDTSKGIMAGRQIPETEAQIKTKIEKGNKEGIARLRQQKMVDGAIDNSSPGFSGDTKYDAQLVADDLAEKMYGKEFYDLSQKQQSDLYGQAYDGLAKQRFKGLKKPEPEDMATGGRVGFFMGGLNPKGLGLLKKILEYMAKIGKEKGGFKGVALSALDMLRLSNPKRFNKFLEEVQGKVNLKEGIMSTDMVKREQQALRRQRKGLTEKSLDAAKAMKEDQDRIAKRIAKEAETTIIPEVKERLMRDMGMSEEAAEKAARGMAEAAQNIKLMDSPPEITDEGILQLENVLKNLETGGKKKRELNATGGRIGLKDGPEKPSRRKFLKIAGGLAALPIIGKFFKAAKVASKVPQVVTKPVAGKPAWFDSLVNKVITEGDDVTKQFATKEREIVHIKKIDKDNTVTVTQDLDEGIVRVEYDSADNVFEETVQLQYKKPLPDEANPNPQAEFTTAESGPVGRQVGPDDYDMDIDEVGGSSIKDLDSDVSKLEEYATGKKPTMKEIVANKKRKDRAKQISNDQEAQSDAIVRRQGDYDPSDYDDYAGEDLASGGIARMLGE